VNLGRYEKGYLSQTEFAVRKAKLLPIWSLQSPKHDNSMLIGEEIMAKETTNAGLIGLLCLIVVAVAPAFSLGQEIGVEAGLKAKMPESVVSTGKIVIAAFPNAPYVVQEESNVLSGVAFDLGVAIGKLLGLTAEQVVVASPAASRVGVQSGRYNFTLGPTIDTLEAEKEMDVIPWVKTSPGLLYRAQAAYNTILDFCGKAMGIVSGSVPAERNMQALAKACIAANHKEPAVSGFGDQNSMILGVEAGRIDAATVLSASALYIEKVRAGRLKAFVADSDIFGIGQYSGILLRKGDPLSEIVVQAMQKLLTDGSYAAIMDKYNIKALAMSKIELNPLSASAR
jgi:polar amino acid transport system substrate-binding protein